VAIRMRMMRIVSKKTKPRASGLEDGLVGLLEESGVLAGVG
jgi:hypothetical protein